MISLHELDAAIPAGGTEQVQAKHPRISAFKSLSLLKPISCFLQLSRSNGDMYRTRLKGFGQVW